ncbi:flavin monoamine oxidase family protein [Actinoplanes sp. TBRC 11911]|uniref:flavin monoamine oxidase family protein n=1 Tax=Actinoplanes sp. TBRC 11911 TaxID=2729386 RepID=UPI00145CB951|nr:flavin monoamine oxidase family protein [Actinoplanes sp. TBRC 11911]NMO56922.1 flavin monoamine oxidase family protein [Actinoplanes sp. TBRC 11911]
MEPVTGINVSRRRFLRSVGVSGGAGALFATMGALGLAPVAAAPAPPFRPPALSDFTLTGRAAKRVVVLGGGITGLACAYELGKAGYDCTILEARAAAGGRNLTVRNGTSETDLDGHTQRAGFAAGTYFNPGPARIAQWMVTLDYCRELGVPVEVFANQNADALVYNEAAGRTPIRYRTAKADVYGYIAELLAKATDQGALDARLTAVDKERILAFLEGFGQIGGRADGWAYRGGDHRGFASFPGAGNDAGTPLAEPSSLADVFASDVGRYVSFEFGYDQAMLMFQPVGGMDRIPAALSRAVGPGRIRLDAEVVSVTDQPGGVDVVYRQNGRTRSITGDFCVAALPPHLMARIPHNLGADVTAALNSFPVVAAGKIGLEYRSRWWEQDLRIYGGITETDLDIAHIWYPSHDFHARRGLIVGYYNVGDGARAYGEMTPPQRLERALEQGAKIHGDKYVAELAGSFSVAWERMRYLEGAWTAPPWGSAAYDLLLRPAGKVYFAGDWLSREVAWQHGAFLSARSVVSALHQRVVSR